jgi:Winged helix-turn helix
MAKCSKAEVRRLRTALRWKIPTAQRQRIQMVLLRESGMAQPAIRAAMGVSLSTVNRAHMAYDHGGIKALKPKPNGGKPNMRRLAGATQSCSKPASTRSRRDSSHA